MQPRGIAPAIPTAAQPIIMYRTGLYIECYNERRLHFSLDMVNYENLLKAFSAKKATEETKAKDPRWMEAELNG